jgi:amino acid permease
MTGLIILLCFVLAVFCCGTLAIIICYQRTKSQQRRAEKDIYEQQQSRIGSEVRKEICIWKWHKCYVLIFRLAVVLAFTLGQLINNMVLGDIQGRQHQPISIISITTNSTRI